MTTLTQLGPHRVLDRRPRVAAMILDQTGYAVREILRSRTVLLFTFLLPLVWLVMIGVLVGNAAVDAASGVRVMQFVTPTAAVLGLLFGAYTPVAESLAFARERKLAKRLRGTPLPLWAYLLGRVGAAVVIATAAVVVMLAIGVVAYDVQIQWRTALASVVTLFVGVGSLAAIGLAVGAVASSAALAQTFSMGSILILSFLSGLFATDRATPAWMATLGSFFPVRQLVAPLQDQFDPFKGGDGWNLVALGVLTAWGLGGVAVATWALGREPKASATPVTTRPAPVALDGLRSAAPGRPTALALIIDQAGWATTGARRNIALLAFGVAMPLGLYVLMGAQYGDLGAMFGGVPFVLYFAAAMAAYGASVGSFVNRPASVARARDAGLLKRLRGTPLTAAQYLAGETLSALWVALLTAGLILVCGIAFFHVQVAIDGLAIGLAVLLFGSLCASACGYAVAALAPSGNAAGVLALAILLPLSFVSGVLFIGDTPGWMATIGSIFPLQHLAHALIAALDPRGSAVAWPDIAVMAVWLVGASLIAVRRFRWEPGVAAQPTSGFLGRRHPAAGARDGARRARILGLILPAESANGTASRVNDATSAADARQAVDPGRLRRQRRTKIQLLVFAIVTVSILTNAAPLTVGGQTLTGQLWPAIVVALGFWLAEILVNGYRAYRGKV